MSRRPKFDPEEELPYLPPATTPEARERQMTNYADKLVERQLRDGTASAQVIVHYLKLSTTRERLENEKLRRDIMLKDAQIDALATAKNVEALYKEAIDAMRNYSGGGNATEVVSGKNVFDEN